MRIHMASRVVGRPFDSQVAASIPSLLAGVISGDHWAGISSSNPCFLTGGTETLYLHRIVARRSLEPSPRHRKSFFHVGKSKFRFHACKMHSLTELRFVLSVARGSVLIWVIEWNFFRLQRSVTTKAKNHAFCSAQSQQA